MHNIEFINGEDLAAWSWRRVMRLADTERAIDLIQSLFPGLPPSQTANVRKQATQIRHCVLQAREYFQAAAAVGLATKPNLVYYGASSLAYALVLLKGGGPYAFDARRNKSEKGHHGLDLTNVPSALELKNSRGAFALRARPHLRKDGAPHGTFSELIHFLLPEPIYCKMTAQSQGAMEVDFHEFSSGPRIETSTLAGDHYSLADLIACLPGLGHASKSLAHDWELGSCRINVDRFSGSRTVTFVINDCDSEKQSAVLDSIAWNASNAARVLDSIDVQALDTAIIANMSLMDGIPVPRMPTASHTRDGQLIFSHGRETGRPWLPALGAAHGILFMLSMLVRYYPDVWMKSMEEHTGFHFLVEEVIDHLESEVPLLFLDQALSRKHLRRSLHFNIESA